MSRNVLRRASLVIPLALAVLAGCTNTDATAPRLTSNPVFAQGDNGVWTVTSLADPGDGVCDDANCTLREAVVSVADGDQIVFASGLQGPIPLTLAIDIDRPLSINGGGRITLDGQGTHRVMAIFNPFSFTDMIVTLDGLTLTNGRSSAGGGILVGQHTAVTIRNSTISGSFATTEGGGIFNAGKLTLLSSTVEGNTASHHGGGIFVSEGEATVRNTTISGNTASFAGAISNGEARGDPGAVGGALTIMNSTITANSTGVIDGGSGVNSTRIGNSIMAGNGSADCTASPGGIISLGHNLGADCGFINATGDVNVLPAQVFSQVLEQTLQDNGGPTKTHALIARGLAVDAGRCPAETTDQRGFTRPVDDPTVPNVSDACDKGAYEAQGPQVAVADLMISQAVDKNSVKQGELLTYSVRVQNLGPQTAPNVVVNNVLSSGVTFVEARVNKGSVTAPPRGETGTVTWNLGDMANQANDVAEIKVTVLVKGKTTITNTATVTGNVADPNTANNSAAITVSVAPGGSGKKG